MSDLSASLELPPVPLCIWPVRDVRGWRGPHDDLITSTFPIHADGLSALFATHLTDVHVVGYIVPRETRQTRVRKGALRHCIDEGSEPVSRWVFLDVDCAGHTPWESLDTAGAVLEALLDCGGVLDCAGGYTTRAGLRLFWRLEEPLPVHLYDDWCKQFLHHVAALTGLPIDDKTVLTLDSSAAQWTRCFRAPFVVRDGESTDAATCVPSAPLSWTPPRRAAVDTGHPAGAYTSVDVPYTDPPDNKLIAQIAASRGLALIAAKIRKAQPLAKPGSRDTTMCEAIGRILRYLQTTDPEVPFTLLRPCIEVDVTEDAPTVEKLWDRCQEFAAGEVAKKEAAKATEERIEALGQPLLLAVGSRYYVRDVALATYRGPIMGPNLFGALVKWVQPTIPDVDIRTEKGKPTPNNELFAEYGEHAFHTIAELGRVKSVFVDGTLFEACCPLVEMTSRHDPQVEAWLALFGGGQVEPLLDWLATVHDLERPTCALYIQGDPGVGKGLFASGVSSLWGEARASYADVCGGFNEALMRCPVVFADESLPSSGKQFSATFRSLIGERSRALLRKNQPAATLVGAVRLIIAANNADALHLRETLTPADLRAIAARILHIAPDPRAEAYLESIDTTALGWVRGKGTAGPRIARHITWLRETRGVELGGRFLVQGELTTFHTDLALSSGCNEQTLAALAHHIDRGQKSPGIITGEGEGEEEEVWVNSPTLRGRWTALLDEPAPSEAEVSAALRMLSTGRARASPGGKQRRRYYRIPMASVRRVAERLQIGDLDGGEDGEEGQKN